MVDERFWRKVDKSGECWLWRGATNGAKRYGHIGRRAISPKPILAHRYSWFLEHGAWPPSGMFVCHKCDTPACVRPDHLFLGTPQDNMIDKEEKGRGNRGHRHGLARLREDDVFTIRGLAKYGITHREIARRYGVSESNIEHIVARRRWRHV